MNRPAKAEDLELAQYDDTICVSDVQYCNQNLCYECEGTTCFNLARKRNIMAAHWRVALPVQRYGSQAILTTLKLHLEYSFNNLKISIL